MPQITLIQPATDASGSGVTPATEAQTFQLQGSAGAGYTHAALSAEDLAGVEEVDIVKDVGGTWKALTDKDGNVQVLTATITTLVVDAAGRYGVLKDATVGSCGVYADLG